MTIHTAGISGTVGIACTDAEAHNIASELGTEIGTEIGAQIAAHTAEITAGHPGTARDRSTHITRAAQPA